jgi:hypothetical protein
MPNIAMYPLWTAHDFRSVWGGTKIRGPYYTNSKGEQENSEITAFHLHNFFLSTHDVRRKQLTYGHTDGRAFQVPLEELKDDLNLARNCLRGRPFPTMKKKRMWTRGGLDAIDSPVPVAFKALPEYRLARHLEAQKMFQDDEDRFKKQSKPI